MHVPSFIDKVLAATFLRLLPRWVTPNHLTVFRFLTVSYLIFLVYIEDWAIAIPLFVISAFSDALDGALARTQNMVTEWGKMFDPVADKLLIGTVAVFVVSKYMHPLYALLIISLELIIVLLALYRKANYGTSIEARTAGKIKMIFQSFGIGFLLLFAVVSSPMVLMIGQACILLAILFAALSLFVYKSI